MLQKANTFVGLNNLGSTCYINSLLQLWFHNINIKNAILNWDPINDENGKQNHTLFIENAYEPMAAIGQLQLIFALMEFGNQPTVDPKPLSNSQSNVSIREMVKNNFFCDYYSVITCLACKTESITSSQFGQIYLNIKGHKTLTESNKIKNGNNMSLHYRFVKVFDVSYASSKDHYKFELFGVLIHKGPSSNVGHFITHIKDLKTEEWYEIKDEIVKNLNTYNSNVHNENIFKGFTSNQHINIQTNEFKLNDAYMLVYINTTIVMKVKTETSSCTLSQRLAQCVKSCNNDCEKNYHLTLEYRLSLANFVRKMKSTKIKNNEGDAILMEWLKSFRLSIPDNKVNKIDNKSIVCSRYKLNPNALHTVKYIGTELTDRLYGVVDNTMVKESLKENDNKGRILIEPDSAIAIDKYFKSLETLRSRIMLISNININSLK
ncbi:ubiquitin carboxyl-terminal hydrolase 48-like [Myzus persicae]|uniref:ubiquitin carboxyl-terminal hydrolase 48-like n=1 Tax=Myzus persicae TaxID=13164 RepID=UPI000B937101|nr:ubiquitin carboxyl-terminal hydrolase 48-like [Myzus persicae]